MSKEDLNSPQRVSLRDAKAYIRWLSNTEKTEYFLPTLAQLKQAKESGSIVLIGKEWTREGWVYDPILNKVDKHPKSSVTAGFRIVRETK